MAQYFNKFNPVDYEQVTYLRKKRKCGVYIINPRMYITYNLYESLCLLWDSL